MSVGSIPSADLTALLQQAGLGLLGKDGAWLPAPVSMTPYQLSPALWQQARQAAQLLGLLQLRVAAQPQWLLAQLAPLDADASLPGQLAQLLRGAPSAVAQGVSLQRHDLILDQSQQWRWVESNPIAAGMGPLNQLWLELLQQQLPGSYADNPATQAQAQLLFEAAAELSGNTTPNIAFVVEPQEDNRFDQQLLADALQQAGAQVQRFTLTQLQQLLAQQPTGERRLYDNKQQRLHLLYFRTGYNADDYQNAAQLRLRTELEQLDLVLCPTLSQQLAGSKWLQLRLSQYLQQPTRHAEFAAQFGFSLTETRQLAALTVPMAAVDELNNTEVAARIAAGWWYKRQAEGGGNVARAEQASHWYQQRLPGAGDILMAPITAQIRPEWLDKLVQGQWQPAQGHISELGIFSLGEDAGYGGYLLRTKAAHSLEGGVHKGFAVLDTVVFANES